MANSKWAEWQRIKAYRKLKSRALKQLKHPTTAEALMWKTVQQEVNPLLPEGCYFQRQYVMYPYIIDLYCKSVKVAVEIDGCIHEGQERLDRYREGVLKQRGVRFLRITNESVYDYCHRQAFARLMVNSCLQAVTNLIY